MKRRIAFAAIALALVASAAFAQTKFPLTITCNEMGADVYINNKLYTKTTPNLKIQLPVATYSIKIAKAGFNEFSATVSVTNRGAVLNANLLPLAAQVPPPTPFLPHFPLNVTASVRGAEVLIDNVYAGQAPLGKEVVGGTHEVVVRAAGYAEFRQRVQVKGPVQVNAVLQPLGATLSVNSNVAGAEVIINNNPAGRVPLSAQVPPGSYSVTVRAPGYLDFNQNLVVNGPTQVYATLQGMSYSLSISANVQGAEVLINGNPVGRAPYSTQLPPGSYALTVRAPGYLDYSQTVAVNGPLQVNALLQPALASWQLVLPEGLTNRDLKGGHWAQIQVYVDGVLQKGQNGLMPSGRHLVRIVSGGLSYEAQIDFQPGRSYSLEPSFGFTVR